MTTQTLPDLSRHADRVRLSAALPAVIRMLDAWQLTRGQQAELLNLSVRTVQRASKGAAAPELGAGQLTRLSLVTGIYKALHTLYTLSPDHWPQRPNDRYPFVGRTPLDLMLTSGIPGLLAVRRLLDGDRSGQYRASPQARAEAARLPQPDLDLD